MNYKQKANIILTLVFVLFISAAICKYLQPRLFFVDFFYFVSEAALIGGLADWFAVTALFRKPLNWPYHTALLPRNREKVIVAVSNMVQQDLLNPEVIRQKIEEVDFSSYLIEWIERGKRLPYLITIASQTGASWFQSLPPETAVDYLAPVLKKKFLQLQPTSLIKDLVSHGLSSGQVDSWLEKAIVKMEDIACQKTTQDFIYNFLQKQKEEKVSQGLISNFVISMLEATGGLNLREAAESLQAHLLLTLVSLKDRQHPFRHTVRERIRQTLSDLDQSALIQDTLETWKEEISAKIPFAALSEDIVKHLQKNRENTEVSLIQIFFKEILEAVWLSCRNSSSCSRHINNYLHNTLSALLKENQTVIGDIARDALSKLTDEDLVKFVEDKAGNDLQWIRINGSIIGGLVGVFLFLFLRLIYDPYAIPFLAKWFQ
jgi:uncharacterized membrane-anchored protein YjiN (DUF445 family)